MFLLGFLLFSYKEVGTWALMSECKIDQSGFFLDYISLLPSNLLEEICFLIQKLTTQIPKALSSAKKSMI